MSELPINYKIADKWPLYQYKVVPVNVRLSFQFHAPGTVKDKPQRQEVEIKGLWKRNPPPIKSSA
jgi:hypothetical protein